MYNPQLPMDGHSPAADAKFGSGTQTFGKAPEQQGNQRIRHLLKCFGLRTSLIRLKVIDASSPLPTTSAPLGYAACTAIYWSWAFRCRFSACVKCSSVCALRA